MVGERSHAGGNRLQSGRFYRPAASTPAAMISTPKAARRRSEAKARVGREWICIDVSTHKRTAERF